MIKRSCLFFSILFSVFIFISCERGTENIDEAEVLAAYLESADSPLGKDFVNTDLPALISAEEVDTLNAKGDIYIIDIRPAVDFNAAHIANAHNVAFADILTHVKGADLSGYYKVAIVCHTGQNSGFAASLLRIMGNDNVYALRWGMCAWHPDFAGRWRNTISAGNSYAGEFTITVAEKALKGKLPVLSTGKSTGQEILEARTDSLIAEGFSTASLTSSKLFESLSEYYIVNYCPADLYVTLGHIPGAIQYSPLESLTLAADLKTLPTDKPIAVYCSSGHSSAFVVAYLRLLGYDARTVLYGTNGMIYDRMVSNQMAVFNNSQIQNYSYVQGQ